MKTRMFIYTVVAMVALVAVSCGSKKPASLSKVDKVTEIALPFSEAKYKSDEQMMREVTLGKSPDMATAKKIAMTNAITELGVKLQNMLKAVRDNYTSQRTVGDAREFENKFEELARIVVRLRMSNIMVLDEKVYKGKDGVYQYWVATEVSKSLIADDMAKAISSNDKLNLDFDKHLFEKTFNEEMKKFNEK